MMMFPLLLLLLLPLSLLLLLLLLMMMMMTIRSDVRGTNAGVTGGQPRGGGGGAGTTRRLIGVGFRGSVLRHFLT